MMKWINKKRNRKGFTLVELVVVIAILGLLAMIAAPKFAGQTKKAAVAAHNANVKNLEAAATLYLANEGPVAANWAKTATDGGTTDDWTEYLQSWPDIPKGITDSSGTEFADGTGVYAVKIKADGTIIITPGLASEDGKAATSTVAD